jgi:L-iditol 2-dehydrogenase
MIRMKMTAPRTIELDQAPTPVPSDEQVLIRVAASSVCGADMALFEGKLQVEFPLVMGHDFSGMVEAVGPMATRINTGDRVVVDPQQSCGACHFCSRGLSRFCAEYAFMGKGVEGSYQEYVLVDERYVHPIPDSVTHEEAAILEPLAVALHAFEFFTLLPGDGVLISGCGPIGLAHIALARAMGLKTVALELLPERKKQAVLFGADVILDPVNDDLSRIKAELPGRHFFVECAGAPTSLKTCIDHIGRGGMLAMVGSSNLDVNLRTFLLKGLTFYGVRGGGGMYPRAVDLVSRRVVDVKRMISVRYPLNELQIALENNIENKATIIKTIIGYD